MQRIVRPRNVSFLFSARMQRCLCSSSSFSNSSISSASSTSFSIENAENVANKDSGEVTQFTPHASSLPVRYSSECYDMRRVDMSFLRSLTCARVTTYPLRNVPNTSASSSSTDIIDDNTNNNTSSNSNSNSSSGDGVSSTNDNNSTAGEYTYAQYLATTFSPPAADHATNYSTESREILLDANEDMIVDVLFGQELRPLQRALVDSLTVVAHDTVWKKWYLAERGATTTQLLQVRELHANPDKAADVDEVREKGWKYASAVHVPEKMRTVLPDSKERFYAHTAAFHTGLEYWI